MIIVDHRRNTREELEKTPVEHGVEVDIRSKGSELIIHHDAFKDGESFDKWLKSYRHRLLILNVKEEGLEERLLRMMEGKGIEEFFFLDQSFPFLMKTALAGEKRCAVRLSEYESIETVMGLAGRVDWVWVDCFTKLPINGEEARDLKEKGFKLCLVSPELQGRTGPEEINNMRDELNTMSIDIDAVCTKVAEVWEK